jgi:hypothetical protein
MDDGLECHGDEVDCLDASHEHLGNGVEDLDA